MQLLDADLFKDKFEKWVELVTGMHRNFRFTANDEIFFAPLQKPLAESTLALVSTAGVHLKDQPPFDLLSHDGDWSMREIPSDTEAEDLRVSHSHYDTSSAEADIDTVFPIRTVRDLLAEGVVGGLAPLYFGLMGFVPNGEPMKRETGPALARRLKEEGADVVLLTPG